MPPKVLIVDDDAIAGGLSKELLTEAGLEADLLLDSTQAIARIKAQRYPVVVLDILMPGVDGLTLCHQIKNDPQLKDTKVVMVSGKSFEADKQRARQYGADLFIEKPYNVDTFAAQVQEVAGRREAPPPPPSEITRPEELSAPQAALSVTVWGCRSLPGVAPAASSRYGRRTSCVSVDLGEHLLVLDAGSGLAALGEELVKKGPRELFLFITHFHSDHTQGLGAFACARRAGWSLRICGAREPDKPLEQLVREAFEASLVGSEPVAAAIELYEMREQIYEILPGVRISPFYANHPGITLGYIIEAKGRKLVYCPDSEVYGEAAMALQDFDEKLGRHCRGADLLIVDGRYTPEDYRTLRNNGHSAWTASVDLAARFGVKRALLFHHDAQYSDEELDRIAAAASRRAGEKNPGLLCALAREGLTVGV